LNAIENKDRSIGELIAARDADMKTMVEQQSLTFARLSEFPQYRALSTDAMTLDDLKTSLRAGEAYYKMAIAAAGVYAIYVDGQGATGWKLAISAADRSDKVRGLRETISIGENDQTVTYPFAVNLARALYLDLFGPVVARMVPV